MTKGIGADFACVFTDKGAFGIVNSFGNTNDKVRSLLQGILYLGKETVFVKCSFRQVNQYRIVSFKLSCKSRSGSQPSRMSSHNLYDRNGRLVVIY